MDKSKLPTLNDDAGLKNYLAEIRKFPVLEPEEEYMLAKRFSEHGDYDAAHKLVTSHLRLVAKIAMSYKGYGLPTSDLIAEGNIGMMQAVKKFDEEKGFRLSTYAMWWIKASIQEYVLRSWSMVKMGTNAAQKRLFFNLRKIKNKINDPSAHYLTEDNVAEVANLLGVSEQEVKDMDMRMSGGDHSLNQTIGDDDKTQWIDLVESEQESNEDILAESQEYSMKKKMLNSAMENLNERELRIVKARKLSDNPLTLDDLSKEYNISRERVRQIEAKALEKLQANVLRQAKMIA